MQIVKEETMTDFINLHSHTHFSILDSLCSPKELFQRAKELNQTALAITDHASFLGAWEALKVSKETGVKLIIGAEFYFVDNVETNKKDRFRHIILLAKNETGYKNLLTLNKRGFDNKVVYTKRVYPLIDWTLLKEYSEGVICLTSCSNGILAQLLMLKKNEEAEQQLKQLIDIFGEDLGLEVQPNTLKRGSNIYNDVIEQVFVNRQIINLGKKFNVRVVPTCNVHYAKKEDADTHDVMLAIGSHQPVFSNFRLKYNCPDFYLKSGDEVKAFFERNYGEEYAKEICSNTLYFANKCEMPEWIDPKYSNPSGKELPEFPVKDESDYEEFIEWVKNQNEDIKALEEDKQFLRFRCEKAINGKMAPKEKCEEYKERLEKELDVFNYCNAASYMLIVADYINWCKQNNILVGVGRGSGGGSYVGYLLGIHGADPIKYELVFERFYSKKRTSLADLDVDFSKKDRYKVIEYITSKYGQDKVAAISNIITITPKVYSRDLSRAHEYGGSRKESVQVGNTLADTLTTDIKSIDDAIKKSPLFVEYSKKYPELVKYKAICGKPRAAGQHAAGIIIGKRPLHTIVPVRIDKDNTTLVEYDKDVAEENGLVKMDILGLTTLDIIDETNKLIKAIGKEAPQINYDEYDQATYDLITEGRTFGVFQFGTSEGTIDLCRKIKPKNIKDLAIITTLARPASQEIREDFIKTREGKREVSLLHPLLERAFRNTYGFPLYDESLLVLAKDVANWELDEADKLRKLTKEKGKNPQKVKKWEEEFINGAKNNGVNEKVAKMIWDQVIVPFGKYSFNCSHAVLYSMISYHTAYLKAHFPIQFLMANLENESKSNAPDAKSNIERIKKEIRSYRVKIVPPDINTSQLTYTMVENKLTTGLQAIKFVKEDAINNILENRPYKEFFDFMRKVDSKRVRANAIQALIASGCFDKFELSRKSMFLYCSDYRKKLQVWLKTHDPKEDKFIYPFPENDGEWKKSELYAMEQIYLGEAFSCGKVDAYNSFFKSNDYITIGDIKKTENKTKIRSCKAIIKDMHEFTIKKETSKYYGKLMMKILIEDARNDQCVLTVFPDRIEQINELLKTMHKGKALDIGWGLHFSGTTNIFQDELGIILNDIYNIVMPPQIPNDTKSRKINLKIVKKQGQIQPPSVLEELEDELISMGLLDIDETNGEYDE